MDQAQGAAGTGEAEQPTPTQSEPTVEKAPLSPLQAAVRKELGIEEGHPATPVASQDNEEEPGEAGDTPATTEEQAEPEQEQEQDEEQEQEQEEVPGDWPKTAKARVAEEAHKRRERTKERDEWKATAEKLAAQLQQATSLQLQPTKVLSEVVDKQSLAAAEAHWKEIRRFARTNPHGADDVFLGKDAAGNEIRRDYSEDEIIKMGLDADEAIEALPQKRAWVAESEAKTEEAKKIYPALFKDTEEGREAAAIVQVRPWILQVEDYALVIGDYMAGRKARLAKQGKASSANGLSPGAQKLVAAPKMIPAPGVIKSRSASAGPGSTRGSGGERVDDRKANEEFYAKGGSDEALEDKIRRKLEASRGGRQGGKQAALV